MKDQIPGFIDTHCHCLSLAKKDPSKLSDLKKDLVTGRLKNCIDIGLDFDDIAMRLPMLEEAGIAWFSVGIYPSHAADSDWMDQIEILSKTVTSLLDSTNSKSEGKQPQLVAIGEIGIDLHRNYAATPVQIDLFKAQVEIARVHSLPIIVHNRNAELEINEVLDSCKQNGTGIMHCFSSDWNFAKLMLDRGMYLSFSGNITFPSSHELREVIKKTPLNRILCETDSPFLSPVPHRGKTNYPLNVSIVYKWISEIKDQSVEDTLTQINSNVFSVLNLKE